MAKATWMRKGDANLFTFAYSCSRHLALPRLLYRAGRYLTAQLKTPKHESVLACVFQLLATEPFHRSVLRVVEAHAYARDRVFGRSDGCRATPLINFFNSESNCQKLTNDAFKKFCSSSLPLDLVKAHRSQKNFLTLFLRGLYFFARNAVPCRVSPPRTVSRLVSTTAATGPMALFIEFSLVTSRPKCKLAKKSNSGV
mgnify:FL=1